MAEFDPYRAVVRGLPEAANAPRIQVGWDAIRALLDGSQPVTQAVLIDQVIESTGLARRTIENLLREGSNSRRLSRRNGTIRLLA